MLKIEFTSERWHHRDQVECIDEGDAREGTAIGYRASSSILFIYFTFLLEATTTNDSEYHVLLCPSNYAFSDTLSVS